jgi:tripartite-type tricarboxylate transporter receptor subunit TctC
MRLLALVALTLLAAAPLAAQEYPTKNIVLVVPYAAGGPTDTVARLTGQVMSRSLKQQVLVENVVGAGGTIASAKVAAERPDGYNLLVQHVGLMTAATLYRKLPYDTRTAFAPIGIMTDAPMTIIARTDLAPNNLQELIAYIKEHGEKVSFGHAGLGAASQLCGMLFMSALKQPLNTVAYRGTGPVMNDLLGKQLDLSCDQTTNTTGPILSNQVKAYAISTLKRLPALPDLPTADEAGLPGFEINIFNALYAPKGTPEPIVRKLSAALQEALKDPVVIKRLDDINTQVASSERATPEALQKTLNFEIDRWAPIIKAAGVYAD